MVSHHKNHTSSTPAGACDIFGIEMQQRQAVIDLIRSVYENFGFDQLHTPVLERAEVFDGHHGEGEKLLFKFTDCNGIPLVNRYDLTVPLARFVANNPELPRPFKRYQIAQVFRDDTPDLGHFREFTQCDGDVVGDSSIVADAEIINIAYSGLKKLGFDDFKIRVSHRGIIKAIGAKAKIPEGAGILNLQRALDFSDKVTKSGIDGIGKDLKQYEINSKAIDIIIDIISLPDSSALEKIEDISVILGENGSNATFELRQILDVLPQEVLNQVSFDPTLARGADYYTGFILEGIIPEIPVGAVLGGGRYDNLVGKFGEKHEPAVGMAFGLERIMTALKLKGMLAGIQTNKRVLLISRDNTDTANVIKAVMKMRSNGIAVDLIHNPLIDANSYGKERGFNVVAEICNGKTNLVFSDQESMQIWETGVSVHI